MGQTPWYSRAKKDVKTSKIYYKRADPISHIDSDETFLISGHDEIRRLVDAWMKGGMMPKKVVELWRSRGVAVDPEVPDEKELFHKEYLNCNNVYKV